MKKRDSEERYERRKRGKDKLNILRGCDEK
jgi:hypothetical protein